MLLYVTTLMMILATNVSLNGVSLPYLYSMRGMIPQEQLPKVTISPEVIKS